VRQQIEVLLMKFGEACTFRIAQPSMVVPLRAYHCTTASQLCHAIWSLSWCTKTSRLCI